MTDQREVQFDRAIAFAKSHRIQKVFETSALDGTMVEEIFSCAGKELLQRIQFQNSENKLDISIDMDPSITQLSNKRGSSKNKKASKKKKVGCC